MIKILTAKKADGKIMILSSEMKNEQLRELRKTATFRCPQCKDFVHLKVGDIVIPHFAHKKDASCSASFSEGESQEHLEGKRQLYHFFKRIDKKVKLEPYFKALAQRPDLLVTNHREKIPIEFQCSTIPVSQIESRTQGYESAGMKPVWLLRTPIKLKTLPPGVGVFQFSRFEKRFITKQIPLGLMFLTYDPEFERFHYFSSLVHVTGKQHIGIHRTLSSAQQIFPFAQPKNPTNKELEEYVLLFLSIRKKFLQSRTLVNRRGINDPFLRGCYELRILPEEMPLWIGVPVAFMSSFSEHVCEWQLALVYFMKERQLKIKDLTVGVIQNFIKRFQGPTEMQVKACLDYRDFLLFIDIDSFNNVRKISKNKLIKKIADTILAK